MDLSNVRYSTKNLKKTVRASASFFLAWFNLIKLQKLFSDKVISVMVEQKGRETPSVCFAKASFSLY